MAIARWISAIDQGDDQALICEADAHSLTLSSSAASVSQFDRGTHSATARCPLL
jgi:hypothetical protein